MVYITMQFNSTQYNTVHYITMAVASYSTLHYNIVWNCNFHCLHQQHQQQHHHHQQQQGNACFLGPIEWGPASGRAYMVTPACWTLGGGHTAHSTHTHRDPRLTACPSSLQVKTRPKARPRPWQGARPLPRPPPLFTFCVFYSMGRTLFVF